jgi:hypothetical protein
VLTFYDISATGLHLPATPKPPTNHEVWRGGARDLRLRLPTPADWQSATERISSKFWNFFSFFDLNDDAGRHLWWRN